MNCRPITYRQSVIKLILTVGISFSGFGCDKEKHDPETITLANAADIRGFDPALATDIATGEVISYVYDNLVRFDTGTELLPNLAKQWTVSEDGREYTFHLETKVLFHDGVPLTARDVIYSFQRVLDPETTSPQAWLFYWIAGAREFMSGIVNEVKGLKEQDDSTVVIQIQEPFAPFIQYLAMPSAAIVNSHQITDIKNVPAGSGPWKLEHWERDGELVFVRNESYWGNVPKMKRLRIRVLSETLARTAEFEAGNQDILNIPDIELPVWQNKDEWRNRIQTIDELSIWYVGMNCSRSPFNDLRIRLAMNLALDRDKILKLLLANTGILASGPVPPSLLTEDPPVPYPYDPAQARHLLKAAGYRDGFQTQLWVAGSSEMFHVLEAMQSYWKAIGINVEILRSDWNVFKTAVREGKPDLYYLDWYADYPDGENFLFPLFHSTESMTKRNRFNDPEVDNLIEQIQALPNGNERDKLISKTNRLIFEKAPWVFLWHSQSNVITQPWIQGYKPKIIFNAERFTEITKDYGD